jgi:tetratricopeptide (TPR) repeat protein
MRGGTWALEFPPALVPQVPPNPVSRCGMQVSHRLPLNYSLLISLLVFTVCAAAQLNRFDASPPDVGSWSGGAITGTIVDSTDHPVSNARVELRSLARGEVLAISTTNLSGAYQIPNVARGDYELVAYSGLTEVRERVSLLSGNIEQKLRFDSPVSGLAVDAQGNTIGVNDFTVPEKAHIAFRKAQNALLNGNYPQVARYTSEALSIYPYYGEALAMNGLLKMHNHQNDAAREDLEKALQFDSGHPMTYFLLAACYSESKRFDDALRAISQGLRLAPNSWQGYFEMSKALLGKNEFDDALRQAGKALDLHPAFAMPHLVKANAYVGLKDYASAIAEMQNYLSADPKGPIVPQVRAAIERLKGIAQQVPAAPVVGNFVAPH